MESLLGLEYILDANKRIFYIYLLSSSIIAFIYLLVNRDKRRVNLSSKLWLHPSAKIDYYYFFISNLIKIFLIFPIIISSKEIALQVIYFLSDNFGLIRVDLPYELILVLFSTTLFVLSDFTRYWLHRLLHDIPFLWEFHKVHHSAKVLTPLTFYRVHPVENILFGLRYVFTIGSVTGVFIYFFGAKIGLIEIFGVNIFLFLFSFLGSNLRHSHIAFSYPKILETIFISPFMHQIHHSKKHFNKNYGGYLAIWDYIFRSHCYSKDIGIIKFGLRKEQMSEYNSVLKLLITPFKLLKRRYFNNIYNN